MIELRTLQQQFLQYLLDKPVAGESLSDGPSSPTSIAAHIESTNVRSAEGRLDIYAIAYRLRLKEALTTDYEKLHGYLGDEQFDSLMDLYITTYPSHTTSLRHFGVHMTELLQSREPFNQHPELAEIASIENAFANSFDAADGAPVSIEDLAALAPEAWASLKFELHPSVQILPLVHNSFAIWKALSNDQAPPSVDTFSAREHWLLWRNADLVSQFRPLSDAESTALLLAMEGGGFAAICESLLSFYDEKQTPVKAVTFLQGWIQEQIICGLYSE